MKKATFTIPGVPVGKQRPRTAPNNPRRRPYTPQKTRDYEELVRWCWRDQCGEQYLHGAIRIDIVAYCPIPESYSKKQKERLSSGRVPYLHNPDRDNIDKIICDALNKTAYDDDSQLYAGSQEKYYGPEPKVVVTLTEVDDDC